MEQNNLYPIFLKMSKLSVLIVGGGDVAEEKLGFLTKSSPDANVVMLAPFFKKGVLELAKKFNITLINGNYAKRHLLGKNMVIATTDITEINLEVYCDCRKMNILVNVADNPPYCDFYMGGIVTKGNVKIGISTNGKSPTTAKRLRQFFEEVIPEDINKMVQNLNEYRKTLKGDFQNKVKKINEITEILIEDREVYIDK